MSDWKEQELEFEAHKEQTRFSYISGLYPNQTYSIGDTVNVHDPENGWSDVGQIAGLCIVTDGETVSYNFQVTFFDDPDQTVCNVR
jgi:hypothetical protein